MVVQLLFMPLAVILWGVFAVPAAILLFMDWVGKVILTFVPMGDPENRDLPMLVGLGFFFALFLLFCSCATRTIAVMSCLENTPKASKRAPRSRDIRLP